MDKIGSISPHLFLPCTLFFYLNSFLSFLPSFASNSSNPSRMYPFPSMPILPFLHYTAVCPVLLSRSPSLSSLPSCVLLAFCWRSGVRSRGCFRCIVCWRSGVFRSSGVLPCLLASVVSLVAFWRFGVLAYWRSGVGAFWRWGVFFCFVVFVSASGFLFWGSLSAAFGILEFWSFGFLFLFFGGWVLGFLLSAFWRSGVFTCVLGDKPPGTEPPGVCPHLVDLATCRHQKGMS